MGRIAAVVCAGMAVIGLVSCAAVESPPTETVTVTATITAAPQPPCEDDPVVAHEIEGLPPELEGAWRSALDDECFSFSQLEAESPGLWISDGSDVSTQEPTTFEVCLDPDPVGGSCAGAVAAKYLQYFPPGVAWDCEEFVDRLNAEGASFTGCDPDYTELHDPDRPRVLHVPNHQMNDAYVDVPPYYRQGD